MIPQTAVILKLAQDFKNIYYIKPRKMYLKIYYSDSYIDQRHKRCFKQ